MHSKAKTKRITASSRMPPARKRSLARAGPAHNRIRASPARAAQSDPPHRHCTMPACLQPAACAHGSLQNHLTHRLAHKQVILFVPDEDTEYDNVYLTTMDGIGYKLDFGWGENAPMLGRPELPYELPPDAA